MRPRATNFGAGRSVHSIRRIGYSAATGERRWSVPRMGVMPASSPLCDGHRLLTLKVNELAEAGYATPALVDDQILVRTEHSLWAFRKDPLKHQETKSP